MSLSNFPTGPDGKPSYGALIEALDKVNALANITADQFSPITINWNGTGFVVSDNRIPGRWIVIESGTNPYAWTALVDDGLGLLGDDTDTGASGTTTIIPAYELNGKADVAANTVAWAWPSIDGLSMIFDVRGQYFQTIRENGVDQTQRQYLNIIDTDAGATLVADDAGSTETELNLMLYALLSGRAGGQLLKGGTAANEDLTLQSTAHATRGTVIVSDWLDVQARLDLSGDISPSALASDTDDWNPTGLSTAAVIRMSASAAINLTGLQGGADGRLVLLWNIGTETITLQHDQTSTAGNRFYLPNNIEYPIAKNNGAFAQYDATSSL